MSTQSPASHLLQTVGRRMLVASTARALHVWSLVALTLAAVAVLVIRLAGLLPPQQQSAWWLLAVPAAAILGATLFSRRPERTAAARAVDQFARTDDLFLTLVTLQNSAGQYQPLVEQSAVGIAPRIVPQQVVPFRARRSLGIQAVAVSAFALLLVLVPTLDPFGRVEAATKVQQQKKQVEQILKSVRTRDEQVSREVQAAEERQQKIDAQTKELMAALRKMKPVEQQSNSQVLDSQRQTLNQLWKQASSEQIREMLSQNTDSLPGSQRGQKMNDWLKELQEGNSESLQKELEKAQETLKSILNADTAAGAVATATKAKRLLLLTDVPGVLDKDKNLISELAIEELPKLIENGTITGGMIPKVESAAAVVESGVEGVFILDGRVPHSVLLELLTPHGVGTRISRAGA